MNELECMFVTVIFIMVNQTTNFRKIFAVLTFTKTKEVLLILFYIRDISQVTAVMSLYTSNESKSKNK